MPSLDTRTVFRQRMTDFWGSTPWFDLTDYVALSDLPKPDTGPFVLLQFVAATDDLVTIAGPKGDGNGYREAGTVGFHYVMPTGFNAQTAMPVMEQLRDLFRNKRFGNVVVEGFDPFTDQAGAAIQIDGGWHGFSATCDYYTDTLTA